MHLFRLCFYTPNTKLWNTINLDTTHTCIHLYEQHATLDQALKVDSTATWWIKADGCDVIKEISESVNQVWSRDVNFNDGKLQKFLKDHLDFNSKTGIGERNACHLIKLLQMQI